ncbi:hypothetical protein [Bradyrhizobium sp. SZCCHNRI3043]|uniref:hypothetical protein n=1 Tax=Bradyrhizobium sp. SZCCHNRI3043 TaxID=3057292 RepID=UPI0028EAE7D9|nr:hypothetical protein [Bradyrhizobium sp. SZCCHNRI3043]
MTFIIKSLLEDCAIGANSARCAGYKGEGDFNETWTSHSAADGLDTHARLETIRIRPQCR